MPKLKISQPPFPNRKKYPFVATVRYKGLVIDVENLDGSTRTGKDPNGKTWSTKFKGAHYGEIRGTKGADGDLLDVYIKDPPDPKAAKAYIVHQNHPGTHPTKAGRFDEDKVVLGVSSVEAAKKLYLRHYNRRDFLRSVTEMDMPSFKDNAFGENKGEKLAMAIDIQKIAKEIAGRASPERDKLAAEVEGMYKLGFELGVKLAGDQVIKSKPLPRMQMAEPQRGPKKTKENPGAAAKVDQMGNPGGKMISSAEQKKRQKVTYLRAGL